ncbi:hypothetical protein 035JT001_75 [Bacillus phage 035JT001]|nr:hypothetical protein 035JT001_75 [Bacillus phage 035JT001]
MDFIKADLITQGTVMIKGEERKTRKDVYLTTVYLNAVPQKGETLCLRTDISEPLQLWEVEHVTHRVAAGEKHHTLTIMVSPWSK